MVQEHVGATVRRRDLVVERRPSRADATASSVARSVLDLGPVARSTVARATGLSTATVSVVSGRLVETGVLREVPEAAGRPGIGRPTTPLGIDVDRLAVVGVHLAAPRFTVAVLDLRGRVVDSVRKEYAGPHPSPEDELPRIVAEVRGLIARHRAREVVGIGVAAGGRVDPASGRLVEHPVLGWRDVPLRQVLSEIGPPVHVDGHGRSLVRAERLFGEVWSVARRSIVQLFIGNVLDITIAVGDTVHHGPHSAGGLVAHLPVAHLPVEGHDEPCPCGRTGCLQAAASERVLIRRALAEGIVDVPDVRVLVERAQQGDERARALFGQRARLVGRAAAMVLDLVNPEVLVVVEAGCNRVPGMLEVLRGEIAERSEVAAERDLEECVRGSSFPADVLAVAGGAVALDRIYSAPLSRPGT